MKKINDEYTFSEALEKVIEEGKRLNHSNPTYDILLKRYDKLKEVAERQNKVKTKKNKKNGGESNQYGSWQLAEEKDKNDNLTKENEKLTKQLAEEKDKNDNLTKENEKLTKQIAEEKAKNKKLTKADKKYNKLSKENEILCEKLVETSENALKLAEKYEPLNRTVVLREKEIEILIEYIKSLKSRLNNQEDDDKVYPEYHTHDTFKVHNKLAEVVSVLVDKDDDVYGYEIKFEDSDDTFIVYPEEIED